MALLKKDPVLKANKCLIFTEFADTARYLKRNLIAAGIEGVESIDGAVNLIAGLLFAVLLPTTIIAVPGDTRRGAIGDSILISTDVLSEGLNLQDATRLINYDIHWNPVRLMQRIGRVDRRMNPEIEAKLLRTIQNNKSCGVMSSTGIFFLPLNSIRSSRCTVALLIRCYDF